MIAGLRKKVRYIREFGFVYFDDGARVFRLSEDAFDAMRSSCRIEPDKVLEHYPSLFIAVRTWEEAERRFFEAEAR